LTVDDGLATQPVCRPAPWSASARSATI